MRAVETTKLTTVATSLLAHCLQALPRGIVVAAALVFSGGASAVNALNNAESAVETNNGAPSTSELPNILLILVDDLGYSDLEPYGSEIPTPHISQLAHEGLLFTNARSAMKCNPTRAMLMSGLDNNIAATGSRKTYHLRSDVKAMPEYLRELGYFTAMAGKWDLGQAPEQAPNARGFDYSVALLPGVSTHYPNPFGLDSNPGGSTRGYLKNGEPLRLPDNFYSASFYVDALMEGLNDRPAQSPFFAYLALTTPHYPLQAPKDTIERFKGWYAEGYSAVKAARLARQRELGIISTDFTHWPEPNDEDWSTLDTAGQEREARRMEVYAAMISETDRAVGRLMDYLKTKELTDNTLVIFASDNGADASLRGAGANDRYNNSTANIGAADSYVTLGKSWAQVSSTPWRLVKSHPTEGGTRVPFIARLPGRIPQREQSDELLLLRDLLPTFLAMLGSDFPRPTSTEGKSAPPETMIGRSAALTLLGGLSAYGSSDTLIHTYVEKRLGGANVQAGDWKLVWWKRKQRYLSPMLFNIKEDPAETVDLAKQNEAKVLELLEQWTSYQRYAGPAISEAIPTP